MSAAKSRDAALVFMGAVFLFGGMAILAGAPQPEALTLVVLAWALGALWRLGRIDAERFLIDPWWLFVLVGAGALWQAGTAGPDVEQGFFRALTGAGTGFLVGAVPVVIAKALGRRWPLYPGDMLLFAALGCLLGPWGLLWALPVGAVCAVGRHAWVQRRRGRSWLAGHVPLGPSMAVGGALVLSATVVGRAGIGIG